MSQLVTKPAPEGKAERAPGGKPGLLDRIKRRLQAIGTRGPKPQD